jgi:aspartyl-tRNA(Asn)/glutamyl-tRNA(Gln) amidotransferase subunit A
MDFENLTIKDIKNGLKKKEFSTLELCNFFLEKIKKEDKKIGSFLTLTEELAISQAKEIDKMIKNKTQLPPLAGVPTAIKDNILVKGTKCTAASKILKDYISPFDATVVKKLKEAGAVILGKTNLDEFAMGSSTENSAFFPTRNPFDPERVPGGSSGGSAAAVASNFCVFALGSDTGGSIRQPASFCKIYGLKPTYGSVSRFGLIAFASSLDQIGPLAKNTKDCETVFNVIQGKDELDSTSVEVPNLKDRLRNNSFKTRINEFKIGIPKEYFGEGIEKEVRVEIEKAIKKFQDVGAKFLEISLPHTPYALPCYYITASAEASSNLARYDGQRYGIGGIEFGDYKDLWEVYFENRERFGKEVKRRIMLGTFVLSAGYFEAYYVKAQKVRRRIFQDFERAFEKVDFIFTPTSPTLPFKLGEKIEDPLKMYLSDVLTVSVNLAGLPAISIPVSKSCVGLQIIGRPFSEQDIFKVTAIYESIG